MTSPGDGTLLLERYRLDRMIGEGGMGAVWAGYDTKLRRNVAVKLMTERISRSDTALGRFEREAMAVARLRSQHIAQVYDYGVHDGNPFMIMELLEGRDLKWFLSRHDRLSMDGAANIIVQVAKALHAAHKAGIVHRDLKPANIFLAREGEDEICKVFDFGVAKALTDLGGDQEATAEGAILGTPRYMAPEQALGAGEVDHRADIWSLGVIAYQCVTGTVPFVAAGTGHVLVKICTEPHPPASAVADGLPGAIDAFFDKALAKEPDDRFASARELASAFVAMADMSLSQFASVGDINITDSGTYPQAVSSWSGVLRHDDLSNPSELLVAAQAGAAPAPLSEGGGTLGPATHTAEPVADRGRQRLGVVAVAASVVAIGAVTFALSRPTPNADATASGTPGPAIVAGSDTGVVVAPAPPSSSTAAASASAASSTQAAAASASQRSRVKSSGATRPPPAAAHSPPPVAAPASPPPPAAKPAPAPTSKDGLDLFDKRW